tara:strand:+ start:1101 stop:1880 length:780 start_codon:yes stop_codon:yes gene_type:complete
MGRFRVFNHGATVSSSDLNQRKKGSEMMKYLRGKAPEKEDQGVIVDYSKLEVVYFKSYQEFMNTTRNYLKHNPYCFECADVPSSLIDGLESELCYDELYAHVRDCTLDYCNQCEKILKTNDCLEGLFPYGHYNNNDKPDTFMFPTKIKLDECGEKKTCPKYVYCKCPPKMNEKCCYYEELFPSQFKHVNVVKHPSKKENKHCENKVVTKNINEFSIFPRFTRLPKKISQPKTTIPLKKPRTITKYNKELRRYEEIELSI